MLPIENVSMKRYFYLCHNQCHPVTSQMQDFIQLVKSLPFTEDACA